jgi:hypothetical protein
LAEKSTGAKFSCGAAMTMTTPPAAMTTMVTMIDDDDDEAVTYVKKDRRVPPMNGFTTESIHFVDKKKGDIV